MLKTLKECKDLDEARESAIKWIRQFQEYSVNPDEISIKLRKVTSEKEAFIELAEINSKVECTLLTSWIKHFFNITEDDLK